MIVDIVYNDEHNIQYFFGWLFNGIILTLLGIGFAIPGLISLLLLKKNFNNFYKQYKCYLIFSAISLSVPVILRGAFNLVAIYPVFN